MLCLDLLKYILKRLAQAVFVLFGLSVVIFIISRIVPGDPARMALGSRASDEAYAALRAEMHLEEPLASQYGYWVKGVFTGDLGNSITTKRAVSIDIRDFLPATLELVLLSAVFMVIFSILLGKVAARHRDKWPDALIRVLSYSGVAIPAFVMAILLLLLFGYKWEVIPVIGRLSSGVVAPDHITGLYVLDSLLTGKFATAWNAFLHLLVPAMALAAGGLFQEARIIRTAMTDNLSKDYINASKGYGVPNRLIMRKYLLKPSMIPAVSVMGLDIASLMANAFLVETIFTWPGISRYGMTAMLSKDLNAISAVIIIFGMIFVLVNIAVDLIVAWLDPRIRLGGD